MLGARSGVKHWGCDKVHTFNGRTFKNLQSETGWWHSLKLIFTMCVQSMRSCLSVLKIEKIYCRRFGQQETFSTMSNIEKASQLFKVLLSQNKLFSWIGRCYVRNWLQRVPRGHFKSYKFMMGLDFKMIAGDKNTPQIISENGGRVGFRAKSAAVDARRKISQPLLTMLRVYQFVARTITQVCL